MIAAVRPTQRRLRLLALQTAHVLRNHYGSLVTMGVLAVALAFALTSSSFTGKADTPAPIRPTSSVELPAAAPPAAPPQRVTYYLYSSEAQRKLYQDILKTDYTEMTWKGLPDYIGEVHFLRVATEAEEAAASYLVSEIVAWAKVGGVTVHVVDLR